MTTTVAAPAPTGTDSNEAPSTRAPSTDAPAATAVWHRICPSDRLQPERGVAALIDGQQIAIFRTFDGQLYAVGNIDPFSGAAVLSRGIVGSRGDQATVASPLHKQVFALATGECLDDPAVTIASYRCRVELDQIEVEVRCP